jgi:hypothetical protein
VAVQDQAATIAEPLGIPAGGVLLDKVILVEHLLQLQQEEQAQGVVVRGL